MYYVRNAVDLLHDLSDQYLMLVFHDSNVESCECRDLFSIWINETNEVRKEEG